MSAFLAEELLRAAGVGVAFLLLFGAAEAWRVLAAPPPEWTRKLVHVGGGLVALALPWLVRSHWTVLALGAVLGGILVLTRRLGLLASVHGVERRSEGGVYFPIAVYAVFLLAAHRPVFYLISVLALVVSDALAALVGTAYGRTRYQVERDRRSVEGSIVFFLATFLVVHLPLLLLTEVDRLLSVLVAVQVALLVTILEAISLEGNDNLIVPVGTYLLLLKLTPQTPATIAWQLLAQLAILAVLYLLVWRLRILTGAGTLAASLFFYGAWSLGGPAWVAAPVVALLVFGLVLRSATRAQHGPSARFQVLAVFYTGAVGAAAFVLNDVFETAVRDPRWGWGDPFYPAYVAAIAGHLAILSLVFWTGTPWVRTATPRQLAGSVLIGAAGVVPVGYLVHSALTPGRALLAAAVPVLATALYLVANRLPGIPREHPWDGRLQAACVATGVLMVLPLLLRLHAR
jgi:dolichol kinase